MARKTFSAADKEKAVRLMLQGTYTQKQIAKKFKCSVPALQLWRKEIQNRASSAEEEKAEPVAAIPVSKVEQRAERKALGTVHELKRQFWSEDSRAADMLLTPMGAGPEEVVKLINEALEYAYKNLK